MHTHVHAKTAFNVMYLLEFHLRKCYQKVRKKEKLLLLGSRSVSNYFYKGLTVYLDLFKPKKKDELKRA